MKRIVIIVPDTITRSVSNFKKIHRQAIPVTGQSIMNALVYDSYDENYYFPPDSVQVMRIDDCTGQQLGESTSAMNKKAHPDELVGKQDPTIDAMTRGCVFQEQRLQMLTEIMLAPFEEAMGRVTEFLDARQIDVFLFDEDSAPDSKLKAYGRSFSYTRQQESLPDQPQAPENSLCQDGREAIYEAPLMVEGRHIGHLRIRRTITDDFDRNSWAKDVELISPVAARIIQIDQDCRLARKAYLDELTQLYNRRKLNEQMGLLFKHFKTGQKKLFIAMIDIDRFKELNNMYGHPAGDEVLRQAAQLIREGMPYAYRYDSDIFCGIFYGPERDEVLETMEALRKRVEQTAFAHAGLEHRITISCGIAAFETGMNSVMDVVSRADIALYVSKEDGRNCCSYYDDIKDRYLEESAQLREKNRLLEEKLKGLHEELAKRRQRFH